MVIRRPGPGGGDPDVPENPATFLCRQNLYSWAVVNGWGQPGMRRIAIGIVAAVSVGMPAAADIFSTRSQRNLFKSQTRVLDTRAAIQYNDSVRLQPPSVHTPSKWGPLPYAGKYKGEYLKMARAAARMESSVSRGTGGACVHTRGASGIAAWPDAGIAGDGDGSGGGGSVPAASAQSPLSAGADRKGCCHSALYRRHVPSAPPLPAPAPRAAATRVTGSRCNSKRTKERATPGNVAGYSTSASTSMRLKVRYGDAACNPPRACTSRMCDVQPTHKPVRVPPTLKGVRPATI